jgi:hypothetical protein
MHRLHVLQWCARGGLRHWHFSQNLRFGFIHASGSDAGGTTSSLLAVACRTEPGSVVDAVTYDAMMRNTIAWNTAPWNTPSGLHANHGASTCASVT